MARRNALLLLRKNLRARRTELSNRLAGESANLPDFEAVDATGDVAHAAFDRESADMSAQLQELEERELSQIERALARLQEGAYGICENCRKPILLARLNALPYATFCIKCERDRETQAGVAVALGAENWTQLADSDAGTGDRPIDLTAMQTTTSGIRGG